jgi:type II secretory pathway pseudopilin PulG
MMRRIKSLSFGRDEAGVSLVEIVIAMFILALMSVSVLPLLIGGVQTSVVNSGGVAANGLAESQLVSLQTEFPNSADSSCSQVALKAAKGIADPSSGATADIEVGACPTTYPGVVSVTVLGYRPGSATPVVTLNSAILVTSA